MRTAAASQVAGVFTLTENPVSQSGQWLNGATDGVDWHNCQTIADRIYGSSFMSSNSDYSDCTAVINTSQPNDQQCTAVFYRAGGYSPTGIHECEILLRWGISANDSHGYEFNFAHDGAYAQLVVWNGPHGSGNFTVLAGTSFTAPADGDTVECSIVGTTATCKVNGSTIYTYNTTSDSVKWSSGKIGCGFFPVTGSGVTLASYGWKSLTPGAAP